ncbi:IclR family transcriptional regulator [Nocardioides sp. AE5]|uniref:IclR family transcriptional regulator n=1 Tax=Nocardioides sp. AE5 TaxID=2962573 RepID=UPI002881E48F|nr:IclR family transcriptional regulator [Nocardioides sp. AE5]MDT0203152.1 IclR family transcriptional regulator [Nocardioides sp. AE5]
MNTAPSQGAGSGGTRIQSVARASQLLLRVAHYREGASVKELAADLGLALPTTYHLTNTLLDQGLLSRNGQRRFVLGDATAVLAQAYVRNGGASERLLVALKRLADETHETVYLVDWAESEIRVRASVESSQTVRVGDVTAGPYEHAHARANGKVLLAWAPPEIRDAYLARHPLTKLTPNTIVSRDRLAQELARVHATGVARDLEEYEEGVSCLAAPFLLHGEVVAAFGISVPTDRFRLNETALEHTLLHVIGSITGTAAT